MQAACGSPQWIVFVVDKVLYFMSRTKLELSSAFDCGSISSIVYDPYLNNFKLVNETLDFKMADVVCLV